MSARPYHALRLTAFHVAMIGGPALAGLLIAGGGASLLPTPSTLAAAHSGTATGQLAWIYLLNALRGRMTSVNMIFFMGGPQLGEMEAGLVASLFASAAVGVTVSIVSGGLATMLCTVVIAAATPVVRRFGVS